jgi:hypothetical protein
MKPHLYYDIRDVLLAPARAFSAKAIFVMTTFLILALVVYDLGFYLAHLVDGAKLSVVYSVYGIFPGPSPALSGSVGQVVFGIGVLAAIYAVMLGLLGVAVFTMEQIRGNRFFSVAESLRFIRSRAKQLLLCELALVAFVTFIVALFAIAGLLGRIPVVGEWLYSIFYVFPAYFIALFTVFIVAVFQISIILAPAAAAAERRGEIFGVILETFSSIIRQPLRWGVYTIYAIVAGKLASFLYAYFAVRAVQFTNWAIGLTDGGKLAKLVESSLSHLPMRSDVVKETFNIFPGIDWGLDLLRFVRSGDSAASYVMAFMLFVIFASILGYFMAVIGTGQAYAYVVIRYKKDGYRIDEEEPIGETEHLPGEPIVEPLTGEKDSQQP